ncbi:MAG: hypothetical protein RJQ14_16880, partial [Marinoscillum sp.]
MVGILLKKTWEKFERSIKRERAEVNIEEILYQKIKRKFLFIPRALSATINLAARQTAKSN